MSTRPAISIPKPAGPVTATAPPAGQLQRACACGGKAGLTGECSECRRKRLKGRPQAKLRLNQPGDRFEREADRVADQVMRMPAAQDDRDSGVQATGHRRSIQRSIAVSRLQAGTVARFSLADLVDSEPYTGTDIAPEQDDEETVQAKRGGHGSTASNPEGGLIAPSVAMDIRTASNGGTPLAANARAFMEPRFGHDFGAVRVHADRKSASIAEHLRARAFTLGEHIFFAPGQFEPSSQDGQRLLAHELTHVVQQGASAPSPGVIQRDEGHTKAICPAYYKYDTSKDVEKYNCTGLAHRIYSFVSIADTKKLLGAGRSVACGDMCSPGEIKHWLWEYDLHFEDHAGKKLAPAHKDFHTTSGMTFGDPVAHDPTDVYSKNGSRPVYGPGTGPGFRPPAKAQARENNKGEKLVTDRAGNPIYKIRSNYTESCFCLDCPSLLAVP